jgi:hypothetical protein
MQRSGIEYAASIAGLVAAFANAPARHATPFEASSARCSHCLR